MLTTRRALMGAFGTVLAAPLLSRAAFAATDPITFVVPYSAGGSVDGLTRALADGLSRTTDRTYLVENKPGANGIIGAQYVASTRSPQTTLFVGGTGPVSLNLLLRKQLPYKASDFKSVSYVANGPLTVTVPMSSGLATLAEFVERAKTQGKPMRFGTFGPGSLSQIFGAMLSQEFGIDVTEVAYKSTAEEVRDILGGQVDFTVSSPLGVLGQINAGTMKMLALARDERMAQLPDVPTFAELGHPGMTTSFWTGIFAPAAMEDALVTKINADIDSVLQLPEISALLEKIGQFKVGGAPDAMVRQLDEDREKYGAIIKTRNITVE